ncbi:MAG: hypothetical protein NWE89_00340 [Candidatus Bathyarchaeota archaeon]|nr:hypothetical protein [Candidatus Bathyarchaeota archaeon]
MDLGHFRYPGFTAIATPKEVIAQLEDQENYIIADLNLDNEEPSTSIPDYGGSVHPGSAIFRILVHGIDSLLSKLRYKLSEDERKKIISKLK